MKNNDVFSIKYKIVSLTILLSLALFFGTSYASPTIEDYGLLPKLHSIAISPDGKHYVLIQRQDGSDVFIIVNAETKEMVGGSNLGEWKTSHIYFAGNDYVILRAAKTDRPAGYENDFKRGVAFAHNISSGKIKTLLNKTKGLDPDQSGMGTIVGINEKKKMAYMPAYADESNTPYNLYRVNLKSGLGKVHKKGNEHTVNWFVDHQGNVLARVDYNKGDQLHRIFAYDGVETKIVYDETTPVPKIQISAVSPDGKHLIYKESSGIYKLSLADGTVTQADFTLKDYDVDRLNTDINRKLTSVSYGGLQPFDDVLDPVTAGHYQGIEAAFPTSKVSFLSSVRTGNQLLVEVSGIDAAGSFMLYDSKQKSIIELGRRYPAIDKSQIAEITTVAYKAQDGQKIPSILTWPIGVTSKQKNSKLPLIVFPHGDPSSYDDVGFDWWAQYLASKGYLILQPNFRGSRGFGDKHLNLDNGKWGREMQDDLTNGVRAMIKAGYADPDKVCIMGESYGGYSALAGAVFSPELYRCAISVGGVADLPGMLKEEKYQFGKNHWFFNYWNKVIGDSATEEDKLTDISPVNFAENIQSPILLLHSKEDTVMPFSQSMAMHNALKKAGKDSTLIELKGVGHWLSNSEARLQTLKEIDAFLKKHNPS